METYSPSSRQWILMGIISGLGALITYAISMTISISLHVNYIIFIAFGPCLCIAVLSLYMFLKEHQNSVLLQTGTMLMIIAGGINSVMAAMQGALRIYFDNLPHDSSVVETTRTAWEMGMHSGNALQLGADVAWDFFLLIGMVLWGIAITHHPRFGKWFGWPAVVIGAAGLILNSWTFPDPPGSSGLIDIGPFVGLFFTVVTIQLIRLYIKSSGQSTTAAAS